MHTGWLQSTGPVKSGVWGKMNQEYTSPEYILVNSLKTPAPAN